MNKKVDLYKLDPSFERSVALLLMFRARFYTRIGHALDPDAMDSEVSRTVLKAVKQIAKETGSGPSAPEILLQRLKRLQGEGQVTQEQINDVLDLMIEAPSPLPEEDPIVRELAPILKRRMEQDAIRVAMDEYAKKGDLDAAVRIINQSRALGTQDLSIGLRIGEGSFDEIERMRQIDRLPTGITELDTILDGGLARGCLGMFMAPSGAGKSMFLAEVASQAMRLGLFTLVATLEINRALWAARLKANLTGRPINEITRGDPGEVKKLLAKMYPVLGSCFVEGFPAQLTSILDIISWVKRCEELEGYPAHVVIVDMFGKLKSHIKNDENTYAAQGTVYETGRQYAEENGKWLWTADQPKRRAANERKRRIDGDDVADSKKKTEVVDLQITATKQGEDGDPQLEFYISKNRYGLADVAVGPLPTDFSCGRMTPRSDK